MTPDEQWFGRVETKIDYLVEKASDHEVRLRSLERARNWIAGVLAVVTAGISSFLGIHVKQQ